MKFYTENKKEIEWKPKNLIIAGYTAKDQAALKAHIKELEEIGVAPPPRVPMIYQVSPELLSVEEFVSTVRNDASGEVEFVLFNIEGEWYVGIGSDHTDRVLETVSIQKSKQVCAKPVSNRLWKVDDVKDHWDQIEIKSWNYVGGKEELYQTGTLAEFMSPDEIIKITEERGYSVSEAAIFCGTPPFISDEFIYGEQFKAELYDPVKDNIIQLNYKTKILKDAEVD